MPSEGLLSTRWGASRLVELTSPVGAVQEERSLDLVVVEGGSDGSSVLVLREGGWQKVSCVASFLLAKLTGPSSKVSAKVPLDLQFVRTVVLP